MSPGLRRYIIVRALLTVPMAFVLVSLVFLVLRVIPGDPALAILREGASEEQLASFGKRNEARLATLREAVSSLLGEDTISLAALTVATREIVRQAVAILENNL